MAKLHLIATGGTIACLPSKNGLVPGLGAKELLGYIPNGQGIGCTDLFSMDSSNIQPEEWQQMAGAVLGAMGHCDGIVITHGTDTMAYTASMLSFMLRNIDIPVVLTGSQHPIVRPDSDGRINLKNAVTAAGALPGGVYIAFGDAVMKGCRAVKTRTTSLNAFESINYPYVGAVVNDRFISLAEHRPRGEFSCFSDIDPSVALIKLIPGTSPLFLESVAECGLHGVVVEAFGLGGVHNFRRDHAESLKKLIQKDIPVILASQCLYEGSTPDIYEVSHSLKEAGVISAGDMTTEAAVTKLMWVLGHTREMDGIRRMMNTDYCGEITIQQ
ncbi:MAG: asparaginase [Clostridia bacterium]|nr:asparaginase [Clostridia bacterium]MBQ6704252.1 asparaginase [Clostridia bacterium]